MYKPFKLFNMKKVIILLVGILLGTINTANAQPKYDTLYNKTIITLTKIGLPPTTIISKIRTSITSFDVSTDALIDLSSNGVNGDVIDEMIKISDNANTSAANEINSSNPNVMHKQGIYYYNPNNLTKQLKRVDPSVVSSSKGGGFGQALAQSASYGIAKITTRSSLSGPNSIMQITETNPTFYFYFKNDENVNADSWFFANATSPKEFVLVWLYKKKNERVMETGSGNFYGSSSGIPEKEKIPFDYIEVSEGIYKVSFNTPLKEGNEYCFIYSSAAPEKWSTGGNKVFDFGISINQNSNK